MSDLTEWAPAKVNLTLRVLGRRADGYHELDSLVAFADAGDRLSFTPGDELTLSVAGPTAAAAGADADNLVLKAVRALTAEIPGLRIGRFALEKRLPVAAGLGGGSSDAAAALRLLARHNGLPIDDERIHRAAVATGADVPVCLDPRARVMRGIGEKLSAPAELQPLPAVLVNPGVAVPTRDVFQKLNAGPVAAAALHIENLDGARLDTFIETVGNDLEAPAIALQPVVAEVLETIRALAGCRLARMSGSGATCFGLFPNSTLASSAAQVLRAAHPGWWIASTTLR